MVYCPFAIKDLIRKIDILDDEGFLPSFFVVKFIGKIVRFKSS